MARARGLVAVALAAATAAGAARGEPRAPYRVVAVERGGVLRGVCRVAGEVERPVVRAWPAMGNDRDIPSDRVAVGEDRRLGGCVVRLARAEAGKDWAEGMRGEGRVAWLTAEGGRFDPHVQWVRAGTQLGLRSRLPGGLSAHGYLDGLDRTVFNFIVPPGAAKDDVADAFLERPGVVYVTEDGRGAFTAYVHVVEHPYVDVTSERARPGREAGEYVLEDVPPGEHELIAWHEGMAQAHPSKDVLHYVYSPEVVLRKRVRVEPRRPSFVDFEFPVPPPPPGLPTSDGKAPSPETPSTETPPPR